MLTFQQFLHDILMGAPLYLISCEDRFCVNIRALKEDNSNQN